MGLPGAYVFWTMRQDSKFTLTALGSLQANVVFRVRPIDADKSGEFLFRLPGRVRLHG